MYPDVTNWSVCCRRAIICASNRRCDHVNECVLDRFEDRGYAIHSFRSADKLREGADFDKDVATLSVLNSIMDGSTPNHELRVCVGCVCAQHFSDLRDRGLYPPVTGVKVHSL